MVSKRAAAAALTRQEDSHRTSSQWMKLDVASLRLKCNFYRVLASGKKPELVANLVQFFEDERNRTAANNAPDQDGTGSSGSESPVTSGNESPHGGDESPALSDREVRDSPGSDYFEMQGILNFGDQDDEDLFASEDDRPPACKHKQREQH